MAAKKNAVQKVLELAGDFVSKQGGTWEHDDWEGFLKKADKLGLATDDEGKRNLGNILEAAKQLYHRADIEPPKPKTKAKSKTKAATKKKPAKKTTTKKKPAAKK